VFAEKKTCTILELEDPLPSIKILPLFVISEGINKLILKNSVSLDFF
jgi:hypothetical protein